MTSYGAAGAGLAARRPGIAIEVDPRVLFGMALAAAVIAGSLFALDPVFGVAAMLVFIYVPVTLVNLPLGVVLWVPLAFIVVTFKVNTASIALLILLMIAALGVLPARRHFVAPILRRNGAILVGLACLAAWTTASIIWAGDTRAATAEVWNWYIAVGIFLLLTTTITSTQRLVALIIAFTAGAALAAIVGFFPVGDSSAQIDGRLSGGLGDPNYLAAALVPALALAIGLAVTTRRKGLRWGLWAAIGFLALSLLATGSRG
ncbi:MAG: hypothetical protein ABIZ50_03055, partial [Solirubrobacterales bacterium]